jgi:DinB superfamily
VPVVSKGKKYVFGQKLEDVAEFVGLEGTGHTPLPPDQLVKKWIIAMRAAQRYVRQLPDDILLQDVIPNRPRPIRIMSHHIFRICDAFLNSTINGKDYAVGDANLPPEDGTCMKGSEIADFGDGVIQRLEAWWAGLKDKSLTAEIPTYYGPQPLHVVFERSTWHSAQHARQLIHVLERNGIKPNQPLTADDLAGLPLPERLFE